MIIIGRLLVAYLDGHRKLQLEYILEQQKAAEAAVQEMTALFAGFSLDILAVQSDWIKYQLEEAQCRAEYWRKKAEDLGKLKLRTGKFLFRRQRNYTTKTS